MLFVDKGSDYARTHKKKANNSPPVMLKYGRIWESTNTARLRQQCLGDSVGSLLQLFLVWYTFFDLSTPV